ncbi:hypothetical protein K443DRAFT_617609 [Laccaria amethystina LaAM-08-1]|uniref:Uncharacterized protein n=1 Tax=Laccaria amethystina LaAM-08-1 TaxID=1095629 RepID=A0A0C9XEW8_9AGAR|nr:hypothetical protein K443DRAFT_617609 [Laccaria amethystina LaAM-08-1]
MSSQIISPVAPIRSTRSLQETKKSLAALSESNVIAVVSTLRSSNNTKKSQSVRNVASSLKPIEILIPSRKHEREEDPENEIQKKARNHNTSEPVGPSKRRDWSDNPEPTTKAKFDAVIRKLLARRASRSRCPTAIEREQTRIEILEADPCVEWFTLVSVMCAGCHREFSMDGRQGYYRKLWEKHRDYSCLGSKEIMAGHDRRHRYDEAERWMVSRSAM